MSSPYLAYRRARALLVRAAHESVGRGLVLASRLAPSRRRHAPAVADSPERILVLSLQKIGDAIATEPALRLLRERFPRARIEVAAAASRELGPALGACEVFPLVPSVDAVHLVRRASDLATLAGQQDLVVVFGLRARDAWAARRARGRRGVALGYSWQGRGHALDLALPPPDQIMLTATQARERGARPQHELWGQLLVQAGLATDADVARAGAPRLAVPEAARADARELLSEHSVDSSYSVLAPWNTQAHYRWPEERWVAVGRALAERGSPAGSHRTVVVLGGSQREERAHAARVAAAIGPRAVSLVGLFGLARDAAILERAAVVVSVDSAPGHIARGVGARTVVVFGPGSPPVWLPPGATAVQRSSGCFGCRQARCYQPRRECLEDLSAADVLAALA